MAARTFDTSANFRSAAVHTLRSEPRGRHLGDGGQDVRHICELQASGRSRGEPRGRHLGDGSQD
eukprot:9109122-Heterocapsa_arctica.AAC.1